eukprot:2125990-Rhodomonas_salina.3
MGCPFWTALHGTSVLSMTGIDLDCVGAVRSAFREEVAQVISSLLCPLFFWRNAKLLLVQWRASDPRS